MANLATRRRASPTTCRRLALAWGLLFAVGIVAAETLLCKALPARLVDVVMVYLLGVVIVAMRWGYAASLVAAVLSVGCFDFVFTEPYFAFAVDDKRHLLTFAIMLFVAVVISNLTAKARRAALTAREQEQRTAKLYAMSRELSAASSVTEIVGAAVRHVRATFATDATVLTADAGGSLRRAEVTGGGHAELDPGVMARVIELFERTEHVFPGSGYVLATGERVLSLQTPSGSSGLLVVGPSRTKDGPDAESLRLLETFSSQIAQAIERGRLAERAQRTELAIQTERLRNALLSSVSHDLRTPLSVIKGVATALLDEDGALPAARRQEYLATISGEATRLNHLVRNLLNMTSLEAGVLRAHKAWQPLEEVVGVALNRLEDQLGDRDVRVETGPDASLAPFDAILLEQVFMNLVENAIKYSPPGSPLEIRSRRVEGGVEVDVSDHGPGVPPAQHSAIFEKFHRSEAHTSVAGMGVGLTICRGIIEVHGGRIWCESPPSGGASFRFVLPRGDAPPEANLPESAGEP